MILFLVLFCVFEISQVSATLTAPVDLGYAFDEKTIYWIGLQEFNLTTTFLQESPFFLIGNVYSAAEHGGTHMDAPYHFSKTGWKIGQIPLDRLLVQGVVLDLKKEASNNPDFEITSEHLIKWEKIYGPLPKPVVVLANFGWAWRYSNKSAYYGGDSWTNLHFPGFSKDAATWLLNTGKVVGVGVDTPSIDPGKDTEFSAHRVLNDKNIYCLENLALAKVNLPARDFQLSIMPMKIALGSGAPVRIIAYPYNPAQSLYTKIMLWMSAMWNTFGKKIGDFTNFF